MNNYLKVIFILRNTYLLFKFYIAECSYIIPVKQKDETSLYCQT